MPRKHRVDLADTIAQTRKDFDALVQHRSFTGEWRVSENEVGEALMLHARHASLSIVGPTARRMRTVTTLSLSEDVILASGRPSLLLPIDWPAERIGRRIVVGWNAGREATAAIAAAMPFLAKAEDVRVVVVPDARTRQLYGADPGADIAQHLARHGVAVTVDPCDARMWAPCCWSAAAPSTPTCWSWERRAVPGSANSSSVGRHGRSWERPTCRCCCRASAAPAPRRHCCVIPAGPLAMRHARASLMPDGGALRYATSTAAPCRRPCRRSSSASLARASG